MRNSLFPSLLLLSCSAALALALAGCDSSSSTVVSQTVQGIVWLPDESGMLAYIDKIYQNVDGSESEGDNLYRVSPSGSIGNSMNATDVAPNTPPNGPFWNAPIVFVSSDVSTAITQFGTDIYSLGISSGNVTDIIQNTALFGVSPDGKYTVTNQSPQNIPGIFTTYILTNSPITFDPRTTVAGIASNRALWLNNDQYALTIYDSTGANSVVFSHVAIYNSGGGTPITVIPNGDVSFSAGAFASGSNELFVRNYAMGIDRINLTTMQRDTIVASDSVESMDVSSDGTLLVYCSSETATSLTLYAVNVSNGHTKAQATGISKPVLSPKKDMIACINSSGNIQMVAVQTPP
jgi:hypothetical protein